MLYRVIIPDTVEGIDLEQGMIVDASAYRYARHREAWGHWERVDTGEVDAVIAHQRARLGEVT